MSLHRFRKDLPDFIWPQVIHCNVFNILSATSTKLERICLVLTQELKLYAFQRKQLLAIVCLKKSVLGKVTARLQQTPVPLSSRKLASKGRKEDLDKTIDAKNITHLSTLSFRKQDISFGKYIYCGLTHEQQQRIYLLVQCWDKLVIIQYQQANSELCDWNDDKEAVINNSDQVRLVIVDQYEQVKSYKLIHGTLDFCPLLEIRREKETIRTDFQHSNGKEANRPTSSLSSDSSNRFDEFSNLLERIQYDRQELDHHILRTGQSFERLHNYLSFGVPNIRSLRLDEKQMLVRCGDIWQRFTPNGYLVIGIPLANQCASPNLTIIRHLRPIVLPMNQSIVVAARVLPIHCRYRLYYQRQIFTSLESLESFISAMEQEENENVQGTKHWISNDDESSPLEMLPESFAVLLIRLSIKELILLRHRFVLMLHYEVYKDSIDAKVMYGYQQGLDTVYPLQMFIRIIDLQHIWHTASRRQQLSITFQSEAIHQDFLAISMSSLETRLTVTFNSKLDSDLFVKNLEKYFDLQCYPVNHQSRTTMPLDTSMREVKDNHSSTLILYNCDRNSLWLGCLVVRFLEFSAAKKNCAGNCNVSVESAASYGEIWKFYHPSEDKRLLFHQIIKDELFCESCNVKSIQVSPFDNGNSSQFSSMAKLEDCLRKELEMVKDILILQKTQGIRKDNKAWLEKLEQYSRLQLTTDTLFSHNNTSE